MRVSLTSLLDLVGLVLVIAGAFLIDWRLGVLVLGLLVLAVSYLMALAVERQAAVERQRERPS